MALTDLANDLRRIIRREGNLHVRVAGTALPVAVPILSLAATAGNTATVVTESAHGLISTDSAIIFGAYDSRFNGTFVVTVTNPTTFTFTCTGSTEVAAATGTMSVVKTGVPILAADRFVTVGHIRDAGVTWEPRQTSAANSGRQHNIGLDLKIKVVMMQTSSTEVAQVELLSRDSLDLAFFPKGCVSVHTDAGEFVRDLHNGFLVYNTTLTVGGEFDLGGGDQGIMLENNFYMSNSLADIVIGE